MTNEIDQIERILVAAITGCVAAAAEEVGVTMADRVALEVTLHLRLAEAHRVCAETTEVAWKSYQREVERAGK